MKFCKFSQLTLFYTDWEVHVWIKVTIRHKNILYSFKWNMGPKND